MFNAKLDTPTAAIALGLKTHELQSIISSGRIDVFIYRDPYEKMKPYIYRADIPAVKKRIRETEPGPVKEVKPLKTYYNGEWVNLREVAKILGQKPNTLYNMRYKNTFPADIETKPGTSVKGRPEVMMQVFDIPKISAVLAARRKYTTKKYLDKDVKIQPVKMTHKERGRLGGLKKGANAVKEQKKGTDFKSMYENLHQNNIPDAATAVPTQQYTKQEMAILLIEKGYHDAGIALIKGEI